jgi:hypothetical protein
MNKIQLRGMAYASHTFFKGSYHWENQEFAFELTEEWSINGANHIQVDFNEDIHEIPFNIDMAAQEIIKVHLKQQGR